MKYRPKGWETFIEDEKLKAAPSEEFRKMMMADNQVFEAGADAMLDALRKYGMPRGTGFKGYGAWVFIPDDPKGKKS